MELKKSNLYTRLTKDEKKVNEERVIKTIENENDAATMKTISIDAEISRLQGEVNVLKTKFGQRERELKAILNNTGSVEGYVAARKELASLKLAHEAELKAKAEVIEFAQLEKGFIDEAIKTLFAEVE